MGKKILDNVLFPPETRIHICAVQNISSACVVKIFVFECMKKQFAEKLVLIIYWPLGNRFQLKSYRTPCTLESQSGQSEFNIPLFLNMFQTALSTFWVPQGSSWVCISHALPPTLKYILNLIHALRLASLGISNFLSLHWHLNFSS